MTDDCRAPYEILPHSYPFILIDRIIEREHGKRIVCIKNVTLNEDFIQGQFMGNVFMPGLLVIEAMAQASGLIVGTERHAAFLVSIRDAGFARAVQPGDQLTIKSELIKDFSPQYIFEASAEVQGVRVANAELTLAVAPL
ncbi:MAG TPA: 3-hydroxyacyl-ACP dehydratase FabZ [Dissulfurispiraceae bacterium]|nr:3-hydroxyacyl-ACP dehydratase FabZ [Dissulfurispiraceae bacterium]